MRLTEEEYNQYLRIHFGLMYYVGIQEKLIKKTIDLEEFKELSVKEKIPSRDAIYDKVEYIDKFIMENPYRYSEEDLKQLEGFKDFRKGRFWVVKYLKKHKYF